MKEELFSQGLPFLLPVWHFSEQVCKPFTSFKQNVDLDTIPDYGGHMFYACPETQKFEELKQNNLSNCPFKPKACLLPYRLTANPSSRSIDKRLDSLVFDQKNNLLISSLGYSRSTVRLVFEQFSFDEEAEEEEEGGRSGEKSNEEQPDNGLTVSKFSMSKNNGPIEQICLPTVKDGKNIVCVRQEKCISVLNFEKERIENTDKLSMKREFEIYSETNCGTEDWEYQFMTTNKLMPTCTFYCSQLRQNFNPSESQRTGRCFNLCEHDYEQNKVLWKLEHDSVRKKGPQVGAPVTAEYSGVHPKLIYYVDGNQIGLIDTRIKPKKSFRNLLRQSQLTSVFEFDPFNNFSRCHLNPNYYLVATDLNVILADIRYQDRVLLQWNHMLPTDKNNQICSLKSNRLINGKNVIAVSNANRTCLLTIQNSTCAELMQPVSLHFPLHLPQFMDSYKFSTIVDGDVESYLNRSKIIGLDFISHEKGFTMFHMSNFGDVFLQDFLESEQTNKCETNEDVEPGEYNYKYHSKAKFDKNMKQYLNQNFKQLSAMIDSNFHPEVMSDQPKDFVTNKESWLKYLDENNRRLIGSREPVDRTVDLQSEMNKLMDEDKGE